MLRTKSITQTNISELAALSNDVYFTTPNSNPPAGWYRVKEYHHNFFECDGGYFAACYVKLTEPNQMDIVVAHRGTDNINNVIVDLELFFRETHLEVLKPAYKFTVDAVKSILSAACYASYTERTIYSTGHSLGATISDFISTVIDENDISLQQPITSTTFENPGTKNYLLGMIAFIKGNLDDTQKNQYMALGQSRCTTYLSQPNMINTNNEQLGTVYRLTNHPYQYTSAGELGNYFEIPNNLAVKPHHLHELSYDSYTGNEYYVTTYTLSQHHIDIISQYLLDGGQVDPTSNPIGFQNGYISYLDPARTTYWQGYTETCWKTYPALQKQFADLANYQTTFMASLNNTYEAAKKFGLSAVNPQLTSNPATLFNQRAPGQSSQNNVNPVEDTAKTANSRCQIS